MKSELRVAIVGAGLAGLAAATRLSETGHSVTVFEAGDRVGGRLWSERMETPLRTVTIERGAEFILGGYDALRILAQRNNLGLVDTGMSYYVRSLLETPQISTYDIAEAGQQATRIAEQLPPTATVKEVLSRLELPAVLVNALQARVEISTAVDVSESAATVLQHVASFKKQPSWRLGGGNQSLPNALAADLDERVRLNEKVLAVTVDKEGVAVRTETDTAMFERVIIALPLGVIREEAGIDLALPYWKREALGRLVQGHGAKLHIPLAKASTTSAIMSVPGRYWNWTACDESGEVAPVLNAFMGTRKAISAFDVEVMPSRWEQAARSSRPDLDFASSSGPVVVTTWSSNPLARGSHSTPSPEARSQDWATLERPVDHVYFAGEYADPDFTGLMEGAIRSGLRAAERIVRKTDELEAHDWDQIGCKSQIPQERGVDLRNYDQSSNTAYKASSAITSATFGAPSSR